MSCKYFCDQCGDELNETNQQEHGSFRIGKVIESESKTKLSIEVITSMANVSNCGEFCKYCILDELYKLDDRTRAI